MLMMNSELIHGLEPVLNNIQQVAGWLWKRGWAEWGAGNISVNITGLIPEKEKKHNTGVQQAPNPAFTMLTSISGSKMRNIMQHPAGGLCMVKVYGQSEVSVTSLSEHDCQVTPTSEFESHLLVHRMLQQFRPGHKAMLHTHPAEIIALSHNRDLCSQESLNRALNLILPELAIYLPEGIGFVPYLAPGSTELAQASAKVMETIRVLIWEKHGIVASGPTLDEAFDAIDLVAKAARIWLMVNQTGINTLESENQSGMS